jgi:hypothetical protein
LLKKARPNFAPAVLRRAGYDGRAAERPSYSGGVPVPGSLHEDPFPAGRKAGVMATSNVSIHPQPLRLVLPPVPGVGPLNGAWWPRSRDLDVELADLVDHFPAEAGRISRVIFSRPDWDTSPHRVAVTRGFIKTGSFPRDDTHVMILKLSSGAQLKVLVIPANTPSEAARRLMTSANASTNRRSGTELLARARALDEDDPSGHWSDDGGAPAYVRRSTTGATSDAGGAS